MGLLTLRYSIFSSTPVHLVPFEVILSEKKQNKKDLRTSNDEIKNGGLTREELQVFVVEKPLGFQGFACCVSK